MPPNSTIYNRLFAIIVALGENQNSFSNKIGYGAPTTAKIIKGKNKPGFDYLNAVLTKYPEINAHWLITMLLFY